MKIKVGTYTGDGNDARGITGVGFQPDVVFIGNDTNENTVVRTSAMVGDLTCEWAMGTPAFADGIESLDADGFTVGTDVRVNELNATYYYLALGIDGGNDLKVGTYTGDGNDNRSITVATGFQPNLVYVVADGTNYGQWTAPEMGADATLDLFDGSLEANNIQAFEANGFQVGSSTDVNLLNRDYYYIAIITDDAYIETGSYVGDGNDNRLITTSFAPTLVWSKKDGDTPLPIYRTEDMPANTSYYMSVGRGPGTDGIKALEATVLGLARMHASMILAKISIG